MLGCPRCPRLPCRERPGLRRRCCSPPAAVLPLFQQAPGPPSGQSSASGRLACCRPLALPSRPLRRARPAGGTRARPPSPRRAEGERNAAPWASRRRWPTWRRGRARRGAATTCASRTTGCRCVCQPLSLGRHRVRCTPRVKLKLHIHNIYRVYHRVATSKVKQTRTYII